MLDDSLDDPREHSHTESACPFMCVRVRPKLGPEGVMSQFQRAV